MRTTGIPSYLIASFMVLTTGAGCSQPAGGVMNREGEPASTAAYPPSPYGYTEGSTIANYRFLGKVPDDGNFDVLPMRTLELAEFYNDPAMKILLVVGSANWCYFCNEEAPSTENLSTTLADKGFRALTVLVEGAVRGSPAVADDVTNWVARHNFKRTAMAIDPEGRLFQYSPASAFPVHILLDVRTMQIRWLCVGGIGGCDTEAAVNDAVASL